MTEQSRIPSNEPPQSEPRRAGWTRGEGSFHADLHGWQCYVPLKSLGDPAFFACCGYRLAAGGQPYADFHLRAPTLEAGLVACEAEVSRLRREYAQRKAAEPRQLTLGEVT